MGGLGAGDQVREAGSTKVRGGNFPSVGDARTCRRNGVDTRLRGVFAKNIFAMIAFLRRSIPTLSIHFGVVAARGPYRLAGTNGFRIQLDVLDLVFSLGRFVHDIMRHESTSADLCNF